MFEKARLPKILISGVLAGGLVIGACGMALAGDSSASSTGSPVAATGQAAHDGFRGRGFMGNRLETVLADLVKAGTITQSQADQLTALMKQQAPQQADGQGGRWGGLVEKGILTQEQAQALQKQLWSASRAQRQEQIKSVLDELVAAGTLDQATADKVLASFEQQAAQVKEGTAGEQNNSKGTKPAGPFAGLVQAGTLTQAQAEAIQKGMREAEQAQRQEQIKTVLDALVSAGTLDQATADKVLTSFEQQAAQVKEEAAGEQNNSKGTKPAGPFAGLVQAGTLTRAQAEAIQKGMRESEQAQRQERVKTALDALVSAGTLDQATADKVTAYLEEQAAQNRADNKTNVQRTDPFAAAVSKGIITQNQADAIKQSLFTKHQSNSSGSDTTSGSN